MLRPGLAANGYREQLASCNVDVASRWPPSRITASLLVSYSASLNLRVYETKSVTQQGGSIHSNSRSRSSSRRQQSRPFMPPRSNASSATISSDEREKSTSILEAMRDLVADFGITAQPVWRAHLNRTHAAEDECALADLVTAGWSTEPAANAFQWPSFVSWPPMKRSLEQDPLPSHIKHNALLL